MSRIFNLSPSGSALLILTLLLFSESLLQSATIIVTNSGQVVFPGPQPIEVKLQNLINQTQEIRLEATLFQVSSATAMPTGARTNRLLRILPNQTIVENVMLTFPEIRTSTLFQIRWTTATNEVVGKSMVQVIPTDTLKALNKIAGTDGLGVIDPDNRLKSFLQRKGIEFREVSEEELEEFSGKVILVIEGPGLSSGFQQRLTSGPSRPALLWLRESKTLFGLAGLSFVRENQKTMAILDFPGLISEPDSAAAQLQLVRAVETLLQSDWRQRILGGKGAK